MPFAATHNYNWLFDVSSLDDAFNNLDWPLEPNMIDFAPSRYPVPALSIEENDTIEQGRPGARSLPEIHHSDMDPSSILLEAALFIDQDACCMKPDRKSVV